MSGGCAQGQPVQDSHRLGSVVSESYREGWITPSAKLASPLATENVAWNVAATGKDFLVVRSAIQRRFRATNLLIAESAPSNKDRMIRLVVNLKSEFDN